MRATGAISCRQLRIAVGFDHDTFESIINFAETQKVSVAEAIRRLVDLGLIAVFDQQSDKMRFSVNGIS